MQRQDYARGVGGERVSGPAASVGRGPEGGPPIYLGAWRSQRCVRERAAERISGREPIFTASRSTM